MKDKEVNGMEKDKVVGIEDTEVKCYNPTYEDLRVEHERTLETCTRLQRLVNALEYALGILSERVIDLENDRDHYKGRFLEESRRASGLYERLEKLEAKNNE